VDRPRDAFTPDGLVHDVRTNTAAEDDGEKLRE